jgi:hypothetical protein
MAEDESNRISPGVKVWVLDPAEAYVSGSVVSVSGEAVKVATEAGEAELKHADLCLVEHADREDMVTLNYLHEPGVLHNLKNRYGLDEIYTYTGNILIAVRRERRPRTPSGARSARANVRNRVRNRRALAERAPKRSPSLENATRFFFVSRPASSADRRSLRRPTEPLEFFLADPRTPRTPRTASLHFKPNR